MMLAASLIAGTWLPEPDGLTLPGTRPWQVRSSQFRGQNLRNRGCRDAMAERRPCAFPRSDSYLTRAPARKLVERGAERFSIS